jgi:endoglycosylceramidase
LRTTASLDQLPALGFNAIRLVFIWEAFEPRRGARDYSYLAMMRIIAEAAWARGMYVIIDFHQDGFSRYASRGSGDGFPAWALSPRGEIRQPDNSVRCKDWAVRMAIDSCMHKSFTDFYADTTGVRSAYLDMMRTVAHEFAQIAGVIGYDPINEPWGDERKELNPFYQDAARAIRSEHPSAILFIEGHVTTNCGLQTKLARPTFDNFAYAPHFYKPATIMQNGWRGFTGTIHRAFAHMEQKAEEWDAPLLLGEYGVPGDARHAGDYIAYLHDRLDDTLASGAQWNYTPGWNPQTKDGWNGEDFTTIDPSGRPRPNFQFHPYPQAIAGKPGAFRYVDDNNIRAVAFSWEHQPECGDTEIFVPNALFISAPRITVAPADARVYRDEARQILVCRIMRPTQAHVRIEAR